MPDANGFGAIGTTWLRTVAAGLVMLGMATILHSSPTAAATVTGSIVVHDRDGRVSNTHAGVVVFIDGLPADSAGAGEAVRTQPRISQAGGRFAPDVLPIVQGDTVEFPNDDRTFHNVFSLSKTQPFDLGIYPRGASRQVTFDRAGLVRVYCNIHPDMISHILVLPNPLFAVTGEDGAFVLEGVPEQEVTLRVWSASSPAASRTVGVQNADTRIPAIALQRSKRRLPHKNKYGKAYAAKY